MTITAPPALSVASKSQRRNLTDKEIKEGVKILNGLETVVRAKRLNDHIPLAASNVVKNEQINDRFSRFIRKFAGFEVADQKKVVEELLVLCYEGTPS
jgi:hypothetical protein